MADTTTTGTSVAIATPDLEIIEGHVTTTSQQIAAHFNKRHDTVLRAIRNLECSAGYRLRNFAESSYRNEQGKEQPCYRLTRDGFAFLAMGFTGKDAAQWKEAYITAFNNMEKQLEAAERKPVIPAGKMLVDRQKLVDMYQDLGKLRARIDGLGILESDLPPSWWLQHRISAA